VQESAGAATVDTSAFRAQIPCMAMRGIAGASITSLANFFVTYMAAEADVFGEFGETKT
jgi:hypothetical protein